MLGNNTKSEIDMKEKISLAFKQVDDSFVKELVDYMLEKDSIVNSLAFIESSVTNEGLSYLFEKYGTKLVALNLPDNGLIDEDIHDLMFPKTLRSLGVRDNYLSEKIINKLQELNLECLDVGEQKKLSNVDSHMEEETTSKTSLNFSNLHTWKEGGSISNNQEVFKEVERFLDFIKNLDINKRGPVIDKVFQDLESFRVDTSNSPLRFR